METESCDKSLCGTLPGCKGCPHAGGAEGEPHAKMDTAPGREPGNELSNVKKVIAVVSGKGGVGKSMVTSLLAVAFRRAGLNVGILDADITGPSIPKMFGVTAHADASEMGIYPLESPMGIRVMSINMLVDTEETPVIWRGPLLTGIVRQFWTDVVWGDLDCLFIDMPPGTGDIPLTVFQSLPLDGVVIVTSPQELVSMIVKKAWNMAKTMHVPVLGLVENMSYVRCPDCGRKIELFGKSRVEDVALEMGTDLLAALAVNPELAQLSDAGRIEKADTAALNAAVQAIREKLGL